MIDCSDKGEESTGGSEGERATAAPNANTPHGPPDSSILQDRTYYYDTDTSAGRDVTHKHVTSE